MAKKSPPPAPPPPDPTVVAAAQTGSNVTTGISNSILGNADQITPYGTTSFSIGDYQSVTDPNSGITYQIPRFLQQQTLTPNQQLLLNQQEYAGMGLNQIGIEQIGRIGGLLNQPVQAPPGNLATGYAHNTRPVQFDSGASTAGIVGTYGQTAGQTQYGFGDPAGNIQYGLAPTQANIQAQFGGTDQGVRYGFDPTQAQIQSQLGPQDWSQDRMRVEEALFSRLQPQIERDRDQLNTQLINQGFTRGDEGYNRAADEFNRQSTDARMQAILAGGQEQSRLFGLDLQQGQFQNLAQQQEYAQLQGRGQFANAAQAQQFNELATRAQINNAAQNQEFQQLLNRGMFNNQAQNQDYTQLLGRATFNNAAQMQDYGQIYDRAQFANQAQNQLFGQTMANSQFYNQAQAQQNNEAAQQAAFNNAAYQQQLQQDLALRNQMINETGALMSGGQVTLPQFQGYQAGTIQPTPVGDYYMMNAQLAAQNYQAGLQYRSQQQAGLYSGLGSLLGAGLYGIGRSDRRIKRNIERIGELPNGLPIYSFRFVDEPDWHIGLMAQDVELIHPDAVFEINGTKYVDYALAVH